MQVFGTKKQKCLHILVFGDKRLLFAGLCERYFEVGRQSRVGVLEVTTFDFSRQMSEDCLQ